MQAKAVHKHAKISAQKTRLVANQIRGLSIEHALNVLIYSPKKAARLIKKVVDSAVANAEHNLGADIDDLVVSKIYIDEAPTAKRMMARAKGRSNRILKRTCHISVEVADLAGEN